MAIDLSEYHMLTPRLADGKRVEIYLTSDDWRKIRRGRGWRATVTDVRTNRKYLVRAAACGLPSCFCDATATAMRNS